MILQQSARALLLFLGLLDFNPACIGLWRGCVLVAGDTLPDLLRHGCEDLLNIDAVLGTRLHEGNAQRVGELLRCLGIDDLLCG